MTAARTGLSRRAWLLAASGTAGALVVGWGVLPQRSRLGASALMRALDGEVALNGWIKIAADGVVVLAMPRSEMGQGVHNALSMLAAEELDVPLDRVRVQQAGPDAIYGNVAMLVANLPFHPDDEVEDGFGRVKASRWVVGKVARELGINATGGSSSVADAWDVVRLAAATARASLVGAAALRWKLPADELRVSAGVVSHPSGISAPYGSLAVQASHTPPGPVTLKPRSNWQLIGRPAPRHDVSGKVDGSAIFGVDVRLPGLLFAAIRLCPMLGGAPGRVDAEVALQMAGAHRLVMLPAYAGSTAGFAVVGQSSWHALRAVRAVDVEWQQRPSGALDTRDISKSLDAALQSDAGHVFFARGDVEEPLQPGERTVQARYRAPYLAHATLEPMNCTARVHGRTVEIWAPTQVPEMARAVAARVAGVDVSDVSVNVTLLGGGFGRRLEVDYVACAVRVAMDCVGAPVQLLWSREEDQTHDFYRPMQVAHLSARIAPGGVVRSLDIKSAGDAISPRWIERGMPALAAPVETPDKTTSEGLFDLPYAIPVRRMAHVATRSGVPVGFWRSVGHSHNAFFSECFLDELAVEAGQDPVALRRQLLSRSPRHLAVLNAAAQRGDWASSPPPGRARGLAMHASFGSVVAQVVEASIFDGRPVVHRVVCAIDCGTAVNPGVVAQQMEGSVIFAMTAALAGRVDIVAGVVQQANFPAYPMVRLAQAPQVETVIVASSAPPTGVGEPGVPPLAPALANAMFRLTGTRMRTLPLVA